MATKPEKVFDLAITLMDELDEQGNTLYDDTQEYHNRTLGILNILRGELYPYSDTFAVKKEGVRPIVGEIKFGTNIDLDDFICQSVMPYGLAAHLLLGEDQSAASYFSQRYEELKAFLASGRGNPAESEDIYDVYSSSRDGIGFAGGARWD